MTQTNQPVELKACPYINGFSSDNTDVSFVVQNYDDYFDFVIFEDGKPKRCFRFTRTKPVELSEDEAVEIMAAAMKKADGCDDDGFSYEMSNPKQRKLHYEKCAKAAIAALQGWRPISEAPRDGTHVLVRCESKNVAMEFVAYWARIPDSREEDGLTVDGYGWRAKYDNESPLSWHDGICWENNADDEPSWFPSFWQPLPPTEE